MKYNPPSEKLYPENLIPALLAAWQAKGHHFGVDDHLKLRRLLQLHQPIEDMTALKYLLAPVFAESPEEQAAFYDLFDLLLDEARHKVQVHEERVQDLVLRDPVDRLGLWMSQLQRKLSNQPSAFLPLVTLLLLSTFLTFGAYRYYKQHPKLAVVPKVPQLFVNLQPGDSHQICLVNKETNIGQPIKVRSLSHPTDIVQVKPIIQGNAVCFNHKAKREGRVELTFEICYETGQCSAMELICLVDKEQNSQANHRFVHSGPMIIAPNQSSPEVSSSSLDTLTLADQLTPESSSLDAMTLSSRPTKAIEGVTSSFRFGEGMAYLSLPKATFLGLLGALLLTICWWLRRRRQGFSMEHQGERTAPSAWTIRIPSLPELDLGAVFIKSLREMLQRDQFESRKLDVQKTVQASVRQAGAIDVQYLQVKQGRQYLALIDRSFKNDHRAKLLTDFIEQLKNSTAPIDYYFFEKDPRRCQSDAHDKPIPLTKLAHTFQDNYLIYCGDGHELLDQETGELTEWASLLSPWRQKLLLSPRLASEWDAREQTLAKHFRLLPCTPYGLSLLVEALESIETLDYTKIEQAKSDQLRYAPIQIAEDMTAADLIAHLKSAFLDNPSGGDVDILMRWTAACAIPPLLFWNWTLHMGKLLSTQDRNYLSMNHLFQLLRLPWFAAGKMPEEIRRILIDWLEKKYPDWLFQLRQEWEGVLNLEENLPPPGSIAWEGHRIEVILNELLQDPTWVRRRQLELELEQLMHGKEEKDAMLIKYLEERHQSLDAVLSNRFRRFVQEKEGLFWRFRAWTWQMPILLTCFFLALFTHYTEPVTSFQFPNRITAMSFSPDGQSFLIADGDGGLGMCSINGEWLRGMNKPQSPFENISISADGHKILGFAQDNSVSYWDITGMPLAKRKGESLLVKDVVFHPLDPNRVLIGYYEKKAALWDVKADSIMVKLDHEDVVNAVAFSPRGEYMLTGSSDGTAKLWDASGNLLKTLKGHTSKVHGVSFSPDGRSLATASRDNTAKVWTLKGQVLQTFEGHEYDVLNVCFSNDSRHLLTASGDDRAILWSIETGEALRTFSGHRNYLTHAIFSPDDRYVLTGDREGKVKLWTLKAKKD
ncbi:MAG: WD40 repeat domain-containing protein [Bacteroidota bacterium]